MLNDKGKALLRFMVMMMIQFILIMLKITGVISWGWVIVLIPLWIVIFWELFSTIVFLIILRK